MSNSALSLFIAVSKLSDSNQELVNCTNGFNESITDQLVSPRPGMQPPEGWNSMEGSPLPWLEPGLGHLKSWAALVMPTRKTILALSTHQPAFKGVALDSSF